jgi:drug/metabolite transporter (DMT)-like permease
VDAVFFGALAGALFGAFAVAVRYGLSRGVAVERGAAVTSVIGFLVVALIALVSGAFSGAIGTEDALAFAAIGAFVPGVSQIAFNQAVRLAGAARTAVLIGVSPLLSFVLAIAFLGESANAGLVAGAALIVSAGVSLSFERTRPEGYRQLGALLAVACAGMFAIRDTLVRAVSDDSTLDPLVRTVVSLAAAALVLVVWASLTGRSRPAAPVRTSVMPFLPAGICLGAAYLSLIEALDRGPVTIVAPLNATQSLWGVIFAAAFLGKREAIGPRLVAAALLVVAGGVLIGISR